MTTFRPDTTFPYLKIAREYNVPYGEVIRFADTVDHTMVRMVLKGAGLWVWWERCVIRSWDVERERRLPQ